MSQSRTVRIFLSSTFRDFDEERRLLVQEVFPVLRDRLRERFVELVDIDLRWGIPAEEAEQGRVLSICLDEIDQCRPYFIGLLGERYGWVPPQDGYPAHLAESHPWLDGHRGVASVTELEIRYGVLDNPAMRNRALFFFRDPAYAQLRGGEFMLAGDADRLRQVELKARVSHSGLPVFRYKKPEDLAILMGEKLWALLDSEFPSTAVPDAYELENLSHAAFAASKLGPRFMDEASPRSQLRELIAEGSQRVMVTGPAGIGKSTLLAAWGKSDVPAGTIVLQHFLEANDDSAKGVHFLRRLIERIQRETASEEAAPENRADLLKCLPEWLAAAHAHAQQVRCRWIIVVDGLDRLRTERDLLWLPTFIPECITLIVSCRPGALQSTLKRRGQWKELQLQSMPPERRQAFLKTQLAVFRKRLTEVQMASILSHPRADQPLFLSNVAEELRVFGSFEGLHAYIDELLSSEEMDDLYEKTLARLEANHEPSQLKKALSALYLSQEGLTEQEILEFSGLSYQARWSPIRLALGGALFYASGRVRLAHEHLRKAVRDRYLPDIAGEKALRLEMAQWFGQRPLDVRAAREQPAQLALVGAYEELLRLLSRHEVFALVHRMGGSQRLHRYWVDLETAIGVNPSDHYESLWPQWRAVMSVEQCLETSARLQRFLGFCGWHDGFVLKLVQERLQDCLEAYGESDVRYFRQLGVCARTLARHREHLDSARSLAEQGCFGMENVAGLKTKDRAAQLLVFAGVCLKQRDTDAGVLAVRRSLSLMEVHEGLEHPSVIPHLNCLTDLLLVKAGRAHKGADGRLKGSTILGEAIAVQTRCLRILGRSRGLVHLDSAACLVRTGHIFVRLENLDAAAKAYKRALSTRTRLIGKRHPLTRSAQALLDRLPPPPSD